MTQLTECQQSMLNSLMSIKDGLEKPCDVLADDPDIIMQDTSDYTYDDELYEWLDSDGNTVETHQMSGFDYLTDALDIEYRVGSDGKYRSAEVLVAFGGPNIWIDTKSERIHGAWWGDTNSVSYTDNIGLDDACAELFEC